MWFRINKQTRKKLRRMQSRRRCSCIRALATEVTVCWRHTTTWCQFQQHQWRPNVPPLQPVHSALSCGLGWLTTPLTLCVFCARITETAINKHFSVTNLQLRFAWLITRMRAMTVQQFTLGFSMLTQQLSTRDLKYSSFTFHMILHKLLKSEYLMTKCLHMAFVSHSHLPPGEPRGWVAPPPNPRGWKFKTGVAYLGLLYTDESGFSW